MTARRTTAAKTTRALKAVPTVEQPVKRTRTNSKAATAKAPAKTANGKPANGKSTARKPAAKARPAKAAAVTKLSTEQTDIPSDPAELRRLIKITRDRRWRASRRDDATLVELMNTKLDKLTAAAKAANAD